MSTTAYKVGDIVVLKSGGPEMTVRHEDNDAVTDLYFYECQWFAGKKLERGLFPRDSLTVVVKDIT